MDNVNIKYASDVNCLNGANVTIQISLIDHCTQGIYVYNSQPQILSNQIIEPVQNGIYCNASGQSILILNNVITKTSSKNYQGIWLENHTKGYIAHNDINGFFFGLYIGGGSLGYFTDYDWINFYPNNRIKNNQYGFAAGWGSFIAAGFTPSPCSNNSIYNNVSKDVYIYNNSNAFAQSNYWGGSLPKQYVDGTSYLNVSDPLTSDPWEQPSSPIYSELNAVLSNTSFNSSVDAELNQANIYSDKDKFADIFTGINLEKEGKITEAVNHYKQMISNNSFPDLALTEIVVLNNRFVISENVQGYLEDLLTKSSQPDSRILNLLAGISLQNSKYDEAIILYDKIIKLNENNYEGISARFEKFFAALNYKKDRETASKLLSEISSLKLTEDNLISRKEFAEYLFNSTDPNDKLTKGSKESNSRIQSVLPKEYSLDQNYPNPFNPSTVINYSVKETGFVKVKIYDILGSEVAELINETKEAGNHSVRFNASRLPSGVYIYTLQVNGYSNSKKMLLIK